MNRSASYEGWCRSAEAKIDWAKPIDHVYNLIRGCNPAPGAWTTFNGKKLQIFDARKTLFRRFADVPGKIGEVTDVTAQSFKVTAQGGTIEVLQSQVRGRQEGQRRRDCAVRRHCGRQPARRLKLYLRCGRDADDGVSLLRS